MNEGIDSDLPLVNEYYNIDLSNSFRFAMTTCWNHDPGLYSNCTSSSSYNLLALQWHASLRFLPRFYQWQESFSQILILSSVATRYSPAAQPTRFHRSFSKDNMGKTPWLILPKFGFHIEKTQLKSIFSSVSSEKSSLRTEEIKKIHRLSAMRS